jgi:hypothetical protein
MQAANVTPVTGNASKAEPASHGFHVSSSIVNDLARIAATTLISRGSGTRRWKLTLPAEQSEYKVLLLTKAPSEGLPAITAKADEIHQEQLHRATS